MRITSFLIITGVLAATSVARAEDPDGGVPPPVDAGMPVTEPTDSTAPPPSEPYDPSVDPNAQPAPAPAPQPVPVVEEETAETGRGIQYGVHLVVPVYLLKHEGMDLNVGIGAQGRIGWEFGSGLSVELALGIMYNGARDGSYPESDPFTGDPVTVTWEGYGLTTIWVGLGLRYAILNPTAFVPFIGAGLMLPIWSNAFRDAFGGVSSEGDAVVSFGFNVLAGVQLEVSTNVGIELGAQLNYAIAPGWDQIYASPEMWLTPFAGVTLYF